MSSMKALLETREINVLTDFTDDTPKALALLRKEGFRPTTTDMDAVFDGVEIEVDGRSYRGLSGTRKFIKDAKYQLYPIYRGMERTGELLTHKLDEIAAVLEQNDEFHYRDSISETVDAAITLFEEMYANYEKLVGPVNPDYKKGIAFTQRFSDIKSQAKRRAENYDKMLEDRDPEGASKKYREVLYKQMSQFPSRPSNSPSLRKLGTDILSGARSYLGNVSLLGQRYETEKRARLLHLSERSADVTEAIGILEDIGVRGSQSMLARAALEKAKV